MALEMLTLGCREWVHTTETISGLTSGMLRDKGPRRLRRTMFKMSFVHSGKTVKHDDHNGAVTSNNSCV